MIKFSDFGLETDVIVLGCIVLVIILMIMCIVLLSKCTKLKRKYEAFMSDADGKTLEKSFQLKFENMDYINDKIK